MKVIYALVLLCLFTLDNNKANANSFCEMGSVTINDTIVFDLSQAVYTNNAENYFIEFPVILRSIDPAINAVDYWFQFDLNKLTYVSTTSVIATMDVYTNFNANNQFLSNTSSTSSISVFLPLDVPIMKLKFSLAAPCTDVLDTDFYSPTTLLNGIVSSYLFINQEDDVSPDIQVLTADPLCSDSELQFSYDSQINGLAITSYDWDFDNSFTGTGQDTSTIYSTEGTYTVSLNALTVDGCVNTITTDVVILPSPVVDFTSAFDSDLNLVSFTNLTTISSGSNVSYDWSFGDDTTSDLFEPTHQYAVNDVYDVTLSVTSDAGCVGSATQSVNAVGVFDMERGMDVLSLYPNPSLGDFFIESTETLQFYIVDQIGQRVSNEQLLLANQNKRVSVDFLADGLYILVGYNDKHLVQKRFEILR